MKSMKLLGFVVSNKGIEVDPNKVKAIQVIFAPETKKKVQGFLGKLNYITCFISQLIITCESIFWSLQKPFTTSNITCKTHLF